MNAGKIGIAVVIATLGAYTIASLERQHALSEEADRVTLVRNGEPSLESPTMEEIKRRVAWGIQRKNAAQEEWRKAIDTGTPADVERANRYGERIDEEIKEQKRAWAAEDEKSRDNREAAKKEQHREALAAIERNYYTHFILIWLVTTGLLLVLAGYVAARSPRVAASAASGAPPRPREASAPDGGLKFLKCPCRNCGVAIEFPSHGIGETVTCPDCGAETVLSEPVREATSQREV